DLDAAGLAAATGLHLGLDDDDRGAELLCSGLGGCRILRDDSSEHGHAVLLEEIAGLVLIQVHGVLFLSMSAVGGRPHWPRCHPWEHAQRIASASPPGPHSTGCGQSHSVGAANRGCA